MSDEILAYRAELDTAIAELHKLLIKGEKLAFAEGDHGLARRLPKVIKPIRQVVDRAFVEHEPGRTLEGQEFWLEMDKILADFWLMAPQEFGPMIQKAVGCRLYEARDVIQTHYSPSGNILNDIHQILTQVCDAEILVSEVSHAISIGIERVRERNEPRLFDDN